MFSRQLIFCVWLLCQVTFPSLWAQDHVVRGRILDAATNEVLRGVMVESAEFSAYGTFSDNNGAFNLHVSTPNAVTIRFSRNGYVEKRVIIPPDADPTPVRLEREREITAAPTVVKEYRLKINLLRRFIETSEWSKPATDKPLIIAVLGSNPFGDDLLAFETIKLQGRVVEVEFLSSIDDVGDQDVLLLCKPNASLQKAISAKLAAHPMFSVCDQCRRQEENPFAISLFTENEADVRYHINKSVAQTLGITFDPQIYQYSSPW